MSEFIYLLLFCFPFCFVVVVVFFYVDSQRINFMPFCFYQSRKSAVVRISLTIFVEPIHTLIERK